MIQTGTLELIGSCFCLVGFDRNHVDFYILFALHLQKIRSGFGSRFFASVARCAQPDNM